MALGGGQFTAQNKVLPGAYMMFVSAQRTHSNVFDRGISAMGFELDWGPEGEIFKIEAEPIQEDVVALFGYTYEDEKLRGLRELLKNSKIVYGYRLNGGGKKAENTHATAKYGGTRGNDLKIAIATNIDDPTAFDVKTLLGTALIDSQTVKTMGELKKNTFVTWKTAATLTTVASEPLTGGENGVSSGGAHQTMLDKLESYTFNALGLVSSDSVTKKLYCNYCRRLRDEIGAKFQVVVHEEPFDYEGVVNIKNKTTDIGWPESSLVYWATGAIAGCAINASNTNKLYDGEFKVNVDYLQGQLQDALNAGEFTFHNVNGEIRVLTDINSLTTYTERKNKEFRENKVIRVIDQVAMDVAGLFNTILIGKNNTPSARNAMWLSIVKHHRQLQDKTAIEGFQDTDITVNLGKDSKSVSITDAIRPVGTMEKLYFTCYVS